MPPFWGGAGSPPDTMSPGPNPTSVTSVILIHPAVWPQQTSAENWGCPLFAGRGSGAASQSRKCGLCRAYLRAKWHLDPSKRLATIHQRHRQDRQDRQRSDSIGRTVLQTVAQKTSSSVVCGHLERVCQLFLATFSACDSEL